MAEKAAIAADALELLQLGQAATRAALEEVSLWIAQRGSTNVHHNVMTTLAALDTHTEALSIAIERLRS